MNLADAFPLQLWINLGRREDRRVEAQARLAEAGVSAERFRAVDGKSKQPAVELPGDNSDRQILIPGVFVPASDANKVNQLVIQSHRAKNEVRGYESAGRYALALTQRLVLREASRRRAPAVLLLEDDVTFHPNFRQLISAVELPDDWGIFYLGCTHNERPEWAGIRVVRARYAVDTHAVAIRAPYYRRVMEMLDRHGKPDLGVAKASDQFLALLHREIPSYACFPNLAWQDVTESDLMGRAYSNYERDGLQKNYREAVSGLLEELVESDAEGVRPVVSDLRGMKKLQDLGSQRQSRGPQGRGSQRRKSHLGLLFLTRGDVNHAQIWREFVAEAPERTRVFSHSKFSVEAQDGFLSGTGIEQSFETKWGDISLVRASRALLLAALGDKTLTHFALLSESCVPVRPLPEILRRLELDPRPQFGFKTLRGASSKHAVRSSGAPEIPAGCWRFTSQWWLLDRVAAVFAAGMDYTPLFEKMFVPDEAYFATVLAMQGYPLEGTVVKMNSTWTWWSKNAGSPTEWLILPPEKLEDILHSDALFARKFPKDADIGKYALHRSPVV